MRTYTEAERAEAVGLATTVGPLKAGRHLGIPPRNVARWMHRPAASPIIAAAEATIAQRLGDAHDRALAQLEARINDPKARLGELARAVEVLGQQRALAEGRATENVAVAGPPLADLDDEERDQIADYLRALQSIDLGSVVVILPTDTADLTEEGLVEAVRVAWQARR